MDYYRGSYSFLQGQKLRNVVLLFFKNILYICRLNKIIMKKFLICLLAGFATLTASAASYSYLQFTDKAGNSEYVSTEGLTIIVDGSNLTVTNSAGSEFKFDANELVSMKFTNSNAGSNGIKSIKFENGEVEAYSIDGSYAGKFGDVNDARGSLPNGVYVLKNAQGESIKIVVNK